MEAKSPKTNSEQFHSESSAVQDIISARPDTWVRWGSVFFLFFLVVTGGIAYFISYPDIISINGRLVSINAPKEIRIKKTGKLIKLFKEEGEHATKDEIIGFIESTASHEEILKLSTLIDTIDRWLILQQMGQITDLTLPDFRNLGEVQPYFQLFAMNYSEFLEYTGDGFFIRKRKMLFDDIVYLQKLNAEFKKQKGYLISDAALMDSTFQAHTILKNENVISAMDYRQEESKLLAKKMTLPQINASIITNESHQHEKRKEIAELENRINEQAEIFRQGLFTLKSRIADWKEKYLLTAPESGIISYNIFRQENQQLLEGQSFCYVIPPYNGIYAEAIIPQYNFGKVKTGQEVRIELMAYPENEFGKLKGNLDFISAVPIDSGYLAKIVLSNQLLTNTKKSLSYRHGLTLKAGIITEKKNLFQRLFDNLRFTKR